ncbi:LLM class flavin-dependent oxidoreductase [Mycobacterium tilburgii]|uniref:LLM class flavin-dependent oxidoreductase n=1 Tax=Mycobacterium tilburgii TaxID=44467 RepID=UPI003898F4E7
MDGIHHGRYGQPAPKPLARTREYINIRQVWAREKPVTSDGPHYPLPRTGEGTTGLGKPLKQITHPLRADIPIMLGAEGPKNVALAPRSAMGGCRSSTRRGWPTCTTNGSTRASPGPAPAAPVRTSRSARPPNS